MIEKRKLLAEIKVFLARHDMRKTALGMKALNNPNFVGLLRSTDYSPQMKTVEKLLKWMQKKDREYHGRKNRR